MPPLARYCHEAIWSSRLILTVQPSSWRRTYPTTAASASYPGHGLIAMFTVPHEPGLATAAAEGVAGPPLGPGFTVGAHADNTATIAATTSCLRPPHRPMIRLLPMPDGRLERDRETDDTANA